MATIASLIVDVSANTVKLTQDTTKINSSLEGIGATASKLGGMLAAAFSVQAVTGAVNKFLEFTSAMADLSTKTGIGTSELQKLKYAAEQNGGTIDAVAKGITRMGRALIEGDAGTVNAMKRLGLSFTEVRNMDPATAFATIGDAIAKVPNPLERSKLAMDLFGKSGAELLPTMAGNLTATMRAAERLGVVLDEQTIRAGDELGDTIASLNTIGMATLGKVLAPMLPAFQMVANAMMGASGVVDYLRDMFDALVRAGLLGLKWLIDAAIKVGEFTGKVPGLSAALGLNAAAMNELKDSSIYLGGAIKGLEQGHQAATVATKAAVPPVVMLSDEQKAAAKAAAAHAKELQNVSDKLTGAGLIKAAKDYAAVLTHGVDVTKLTKDAQADVNKVMQAALEVYTAQGKIAPQAMRDLYIATAQLPPVINGLGDGWKKFGENVDVAIPKMKTFSLEVKAGLNSWNEFGFDVGKPTIPEAVKRTESAFHKVADVLDLIPGKMAAIASEAMRTAGVVMDKLASGDVWGAVVAAAAGAVKLITSVWTTFFGTAGRDLVKEFAASMGGFDALHAKLLTLGAAGEQLWIKLTQGVGRNNPAEAKAAIEAINAALAGQDAWMSRLPDLIETYGLSWEQAGIKARQAHLDDIAQGLIQDFLDLTRAGFDVEVVTTHMADAVNEYFHSALRTGVEVPAAMRPILQKMIDLGLLTDAAGVKLDDLSSVTFATTLTQGFRDVVDAIHELTQALGGAGSAIDAINARRIHIPVDEAPGTPPDGEAPASSAARFNRGGFSVIQGGGGGGGNADAAAADRHFMLVQIPKAITAALQKGAA